MLSACYVTISKRSGFKTCSKKFSSKNKTYDSVVTVTKIREYLWKGKRAINYNPNRHPRSQDLKGIIALNFAVNIVTTNYMKKKGRITSDNFFSYRVKISRKYRY